MSLRHVFSHKGSGGFTLVELMVAITVSLILMVGVGQIYITTKRAYNLNEELARLQENARFAMEMINTDVRKAGYMGCAGLTENFINPAGTGYVSDLFDFFTPTGGWEYTANSGSPKFYPGATQTYTNTALTASITKNNWDNAAGLDLPDDLDKRVVQNTDVIAVKWAEELADIKPANNNVKQSAKLKLTGASTMFPQGTLVLVSDCTGGDLFMTDSNSNSVNLVRGNAGGIEPGNIGASNHWSKIWNENASLSTVRSAAYFVGIGANGTPALYRASFEQGSLQVEEMVENIENLQVLYGEDTDGDGIVNQYTTAANVSHGRVASVKIGMVIRSDREVEKSDKAQQLELLGGTLTTPDDRRLRYVYTSTIKLRNRGTK